MITIIDLSAEFWRNYFATRSDVDAYQLTLEKLLWYRDECDRTVVACDSGPLLRSEWYPEYKANRDEKPQDALDSLRAIREQVSDLGIAMVACRGYEADDVIATIVKQAWLDEIQILSSDKDLYQLVSDTVRLIGKRGFVGPKECVDKFGVRPDQIRDFLTLTGDAADNIPGCPNVGPGRARDLLQKFETLDGVLASPDDELRAVRGIGDKTLVSLRAWDPSLAKRLTTLLDDAPLDVAALWETRKAS